ncbi:MAG: OmpA family protein, partial [Kiloniellaceae bacterium]
DDAKANLAALAARMTETQSTRVQLLAYARDAGSGSSRARRLSLSRALAVRAFLIDKGIRSTRMDVRALGGKSGDGPADRVDIVPQSRS